jgi:hypothetical protein
MREVPIKNIVYIRIIIYGNIARFRRNGGKVEAKG